jgi:Amt family ammonium transporter
LLEDTPTGTHIGELGWVFFLFQLGFAGTAVKIVSGAMAERVAFHTYVLCALINAVVIYPLVAHWVWGGTMLEQDTWLAGMGFHDFAGSTVVHTVGGTISLVSIWMLGPRLGRFDADGTQRPQDSFNVPLAGLGVVILWLGWWGFNGGSGLRANDDAAMVIVNTNLAGATGGLLAWLHGRWQTPDRDVEGKFMGGALAGLVAITACADWVTPIGALAVGALGGLAHNYCWELLLKLRIDDPVGAVPVHLAGGIMGTLSVGMFGTSDHLDRSRVAQIGVQALGSGIVIAFCAVATFLLLFALKKTVGLRVSPRAENAGLTLCRTPDEPTPATPDADKLRKLMGE